MPKRIDMSEEERIVVFTKRQLQDKPFLNAKLLREQLLSNYDNLKLTKYISELSPKSLENYIMMAKCLFIPRPKYPYFSTAYIFLANSAELRSAKDFGKKYQQKELRLMHTE